MIAVLLVRLRVQRAIRVVRIDLLRRRQAGPGDRCRIIFGHSRGLIVVTRVDGRRYRGVVRTVVVLNRRSRGRLQPPETVVPIVESLIAGSRGVRPSGEVVRPCGAHRVRGGPLPGPVVRQAGALGGRDGHTGAVGVPGIEHHPIHRIVLKPQILILVRIGGIRVVRQDLRAVARSVITVTDAVTEPGDMCGAPERVEVGSIVGHHQAVVELRLVREPPVDVIAIGCDAVGARIGQLGEVVRAIVRVGLTHPGVIAPRAGHRG